MSAPIRVVAGATASIPPPTFVTVDGTGPADPTTVPTVELVNDLGTAVVFTGPALVSDVYRITIAADAVPSPALLTATWSATADGLPQVIEQTIEVVGGVYVTLADLMQLPDLTAGKYTPDLLAGLATEFEDIAEEYTGHAWVQRFARETLHHARGGRVMLAHTRLERILSAVDADQVAIDTTSWGFRDTGLVDCGWLSGPTTIRYLHGRTAPVPPRLVQATKDYVRSKALERIGGNRVGRDVLSSTDGAGGSIRYSTPDWHAGRPTGYLDVDATLNALGGPIPGHA